MFRTVEISHTIDRSLATLVLGVALWFTVATLVLSAFVRVAPHKAIGDQPVKKAAPMVVRGPIAQNP